MSVYDSNAKKELAVDEIGTEDEIQKIKLSKTRAILFYSALEGHGITMKWLAERGLDLPEYLMPVIPEYFTYTVLADCLYSRIDVKKEFTAGNLTFAGISHLMKLGILPVSKVKDLMRVRMSAEDLDMLISQCTKDSMRTKYMINARELFISFFGWSIPTLDAALSVADFIYKDKTLEVGGGTGIWSKFLNFYQVDIMCTDDFSCDYQHFNYEWHPVLNMDATEACVFYKPSCLFISWGDEFILDVLKVFTGKKLVIIGEEFGIVHGEWKELETKTILIPRWCGHTDVIKCYTRS